METGSAHDLPPCTSIITDEQFRMVTLAICVITLPFDVIGVYCVLLKSPPATRKYKWVLLNFQIWTLAMDINTLAVSAPLFYSSSQAVCNLGIFYELGIPPGYYYVVYPLTKFGTLVAIYQLFEFRHQCIVSPNSIFYKKNQKLRVFIIGLHYFFGALIVYIQVVMIPTNQAAELIQIALTLKCIPPKLFSRWSLVIQSSDFTLSFTRMVLVGLSIYFAELLIYVVHSVWSLKRGNIFLSKATRKLQRQFLITLFAQVSIPTITICIPLIYTRISPQYDSSDMSDHMINQIIVMTRGLASTLSLIFFDKTYRTFLKDSGICNFFRFGKKHAAVSSLVVVVYVTKMHLIFAHGTKTYPGYNWKMKFFSHLVVLFFFKFTFGFDNERSMSTPEMIEYFKYPVETHVVETEDGYLLDMHRIPYGRDLRTIPKCTEKRPVALLMHALISTDAQFLLNLPSESQAFMMADAGFDVWMPNVRGNRYGRRHKTLQIIDMRFWNFTWYEHAHYDLTSSVDYILNATGHESLYYIGHSQGATILFAKLAESSPEWQSKIKKFYAMAPSCGFSHALLPMNIFGMTVIQDLAALVLDGKFGHFPIGLPNVVMDAVAKICGTTLSAFACTLVYEAVDFKRESLDQFNQTRLSTYLGHVPSTTSTLNILHWAQMLKYHDLRKLDLGVKRNFAMYGAPTAPVFDLSQIVAPTVVYFSGDDHISDSADVREHLLTRMGTALERYVDLDHFTHFDYVIGLRAAEEVFKPIIMDIYDDLEKNGC